MSKAICFAAEAAAFLGVMIKLGIFEGDLRLYQFLYFTTLSNVLVMIYFLLELRNKNVINKAFIKGITRISIFTTFAIYHFILSDNGFGGGDISLQWLGSLLLHYVTPFCTAAYWLIFDRKEIIKWREPISWLIFPGAYFIFIVVIAHIGSFFPNQATPYPYFFIDVFSLGWKRVLINVSGAGCFFAAVGYGILGLNYISVNKN